MSSSSYSNHSNSTVVLHFLHSVRINGLSISACLRSIRAKCYANYFDNKGNDAWTEMDEYQEMQEEDRIERQIESRLEMASSCECGAYQIKGMEVYQVADCCCGAV